MSKEFSVYWWGVGGTQHEEKHFVEVGEAVDAVRRLCGPACRPVVERVIITDGGDYTNFEWTKEKGQIFPDPVKENMLVGC